MKIALLFPSWTGGYGLFGYFNRKGSILPPMNLALMAAVAEQHGHEVIVVDAEAERLTQRETIERALAFKPDIVGLTATSPFFHLNVKLATGIRTASPSTTIVIGGSHITITGEKSLLPCFDYLFVGDGEKSLPEFLSKYKSGGDFSTVRGLVYRDGDKVVATEPRESTGIEGKYALDNVPLPARHLLKTKLYNIGTMKGRVNFTTILSTRGCPFSCIFCKSDALNSTRVRFRSPQSVVAEMRGVVEDYSIRHFYILDDVLTLSRKRTLEMCDCIDKCGLKITFEGSTRANMVDEELMQRLSKSGLIRLSFGLETVDDKMRETMNKKVPMDAYDKANELCNKYGVEALNSVMIGLPGETRETVKSTLAYLRHSRAVKQANFAIAVPYPGTKFYDMAVSGDGVKLMTDDLSKYRRYGSAVTTVGELTPEDLLEIQNDGFVSIYSASWRWKPMINKMGIIGALLMLVRVGELMIRKYRRSI